MRIIVDTNVLISALGWKEGNPHNIIKKCFKKELTLIISPDIIAEFKEVALRPKFEFSPEEIDEFTSALIEISQVVQPEKTFNIIIADPDDNKFLDAAVAGKADFIVSGDKHLLDIKEFRNIKIITPTEFLKISEKQLKGP